MGLTLLSFAFAFLLGTFVAACRVSPVPPLRLFGAVWVEIFRNTPLTVMMVIFFFGFTKIGIGPYEPFPSAVMVLSVYTSAFVAETLRSGVNTVAGGQGEAARSIGLTFVQTLLLVVLPQAIRSVVGPIGSVFIALTKNSSIASVISVLELSKMSENLITETARPFPVLIGSGIAYLILTLPSGFLFGALERKVAFKR